MSQGTVAIGLFALAITACGGLGNPGDDASGNPFNTTTAVPPWMGSDTGAPTTGGQLQGGSTTTSGASESASGSSGTPTTGDATGDGTSTSTSGTSTSTGDEGGPPKLDLPPSLSTGNDEDKDKDKDKDKDVDTL